MVCPIRVTLVVPEDLFKMYERLTAIRSHARSEVGKGLVKISDTIREAMIQGLMVAKEMDKEAVKRLEEKMKKEKQIKKK